MKPKACYEMVVTNKETAKAMLKEVVKYIGLAFHPDTPAEEYIDVFTKKPIFEKFEAEFLNANLTNASELLDDIYDDSIEFWHEFGMIDNVTYMDLKGEFE
jgi:hypothetical protein